MFSNKQKQSMVEKGLTEFVINERFRDFIKWIIEEYDAVFDELIKQKCEDCYIRKNHAEDVAQGIVKYE